MKLKYNVDDLNKSKYLLVRHIGYFFSSIGLFILSLFCLMYAIYASLIWLSYSDISGIKSVWVEYFELLKKIWTED